MRYGAAPSGPRDVALRLGSWGLRFDTNAVAAGALGDVHDGIGTLKQRFEGLVGLGYGDTEGEGDLRDLLTLGVQESTAGDDESNLLGDGAGAGQIGVGQKHGELFSTDARGHVAPLDVGADDIGLGETPRVATNFPRQMLRLDAGVGGAVSRVLDERSQIRQEDLKEESRGEEENTREEAADIRRIGVGISCCDAQAARRRAESAVEIAAMERRTCWNCDSAAHTGPAQRATVMEVLFPPAGVRRDSRPERFPGSRLLVRRGP